MIKLSDQFTVKRLLRFTFPSVIMMVFTSIYGVVDGFLYPIMWVKRRLPLSIS